MPILFISYSRKQQDKAIQLDTMKFSQFYWWMDYRIVGTVNWWANICEAIEESYCMIALISQTYLDSVYCQGELDYALKLNKPILCFMLEANLAYPKALSDKNVQFVNAFDWDIQKVVFAILEALHRVEVDYNEKIYTRDFSKRAYLRPITPTPAQNAIAEDKELAHKLHDAQNQPQPILNVGKSIIQAANHLEKAEYEEAIPLLESVRNLAKDKDQELIAEMLQEARLGSRYQQIAALAKVNRMQSRACQEYQAFRREQPTYPDESGLKGLCLPKVKDILPQPFDWCEIPAGKVTLGDGWDREPYGVGETFEVPAFSMAKYPVTNAQYRLFVEAGGYQNKAWWTEAGWETKESENWTEPRYWSDEDAKDFQAPDKPVVGVSWYEAVAFCQWLSATSSEKISLPTEQQWQRAAQGDDRRVYPWGNEFDFKKANGNESGIGKTSSVTAYPNGKSPYGVFDMTGNVTEWCLTEYQTGNNNINGTKSRVLRGGSWNSDADFMRCSNRIMYHPTIWFDFMGFRCALSLQ